MALCEHCKIAKRSSCEGQEGWDELEKRFDSAYARIKKMKEENETIEGIEEEFEKRKNHMVATRSQNARQYRTVAQRRGCSNLNILPFAK